MFISKKFFKTKLVLVLSAGLFLQPFFAQKALALDTAVSLDIVDKATTSNKIVVLDPGHDGTHEGTTASSLSESYLNLQIALYCKAELEEYEDVTVYMTRETQDCPHAGTTAATDNKLRVDYASSVKADYYVSLHLNYSASPDTSGATVFYPNSNGNAAVGESGKALASSIQKQLVALGLKDNGIAFRNSETGSTFDDGTLMDYYGVIKWSKEYGFPGIIVEHCFQSSTSDVKNFLSTDEGLKKLGIADAKGIADNLGLSKEAPKAVSITSATAKTGCSIKLKWTSAANADGYCVYRAGKENGKYKLVKKITGSSKLTYTDTKLNGNKEYFYKVLAYNSAGESDLSAAAKAKTNDSSAIKKLVATSKPSVAIAWTKTLGCDGYYIYRSDTKDGEYKKINTLSGINSKKMTDSSVKTGNTYYYKVQPFVIKEGKQSACTLGSTAKVSVITSAEIVGTTRKKDGIVVRWKKVEGADGYKVYASDKGTGDFKVIKTLSSGAKLKYKDKTIQTGHMRYYKVVPYASQLGGTMIGEAANTWLEIGGFYKIMGSSNVTVEDMVSYYKSSGATYPSDVYSSLGASTIDDFCKIVYDEAADENVRAEVLFSQICNETGFLKFGGRVKASQCNFGGLGAVDGSGNSLSATFKDVRTGIRAQVQHLKAYGNKKALNKECVDTRFSVVERGCAKYVEWLSIPNNPNNKGWASNIDYGPKLLAGIKAMRNM